ncbi:MAG: transcription antitermination factor NusB [Longibaculum muris]|uniref:NusB antitermination factor n=1 Tax=Longibaculum muris TaxID=1796628 RepID=A0A4R3Z3K1_9FIRM|nr:transcription antitermination factor NusB [Longibaculum muris]KXU52437.1 transcription antitermination factor NusB [Candidatus Stoquefichus sp. KLE1796]MBS5370297.1 transcription antitermination factor NusB [Coprobacillus cateniformis]MCR1888639.1 transcription antitermination factor NusB [Longibaculum muris]MED9812972.1 transcription antitermination factor NusB [Longibaculum muris]TCV98494.1 NusB antitermination factor [Longibaculum muris]
MEKTRRQIARETATIGIYQNLLVESSLEDIYHFLSENETLTKSQESMEFAKWLVEKTVQNRKSYQDLIEKHLKKGWTFTRLSVMERAILLIATCELLESELPKTIVINEAVINAKKFCDDDSYKFINGVLSQVI